MLRIAHVITRFVNGGADENTLLTCNQQAAAGHRVWLIHGAVFTERMLGLLDPRIQVIFVPSMVHEIAPANEFRALWTLARHLRRIYPDVVHTHTSKAGILGRFAALAVPRAKVVHGVHILPFVNEPPAKRMFYLALEKLAALRTHAFVDVSDGMRTLCLQHGLGSAANHFVIASGMDITRFKNAKPADDLSSFHPTSGSAVLVGYVAVLERRKRHRELLSALFPLMEKHASVHILFAGEGPERSFLEKMISEKGLKSRIHLLGFREDVERVLAVCDICAFVSEREGLPRSIVQYALAGKPIVAMDLSGIEKIVTDQKNGYVIPGDAFELFAARLEMLVNDDLLRKNMATASSTLDLSDWDAQVMAQRIEREVYYGHLGLQFDRNRLT